MWKGLRLLAALSVICVLAHCSSETDAEGVCEPGRSVNCTCTNGATGSQVCRTDGSGWDSCRCDGEDAAGGTAGSGSGGTSSGGTSSGGTGTSSGGTGPTTGGGSGSAGVSNDAGINCPAGSATSVTEGECDMVAQNCSQGRTCRIQPVDGGAPRTACIDLGDGTSQLGQSCTSHQQCAAGLSCVLSKCTRPCCSQHEATLCQSGACDLQVSFANGSAFMQVCTFAPSCTPWANDCPAGPETDCHLQGNEFKCSFPNYSADAGSTLGQSCVYLNDCGDSQFCLYPTSGAASGTCRWLCKLSEQGAPDAGTIGGPPGQGGCASNETCVALSGPSFIGVCRP